MADKEIFIPTEAEPTALDKALEGYNMDQAQQKIEQLEATRRYQAQRIEEQQQTIDKQQRELNRLRPLVEQGYHLLSLIEIEAQRRAPNFSLLGFVRISLEDMKNFFTATQNKNA